MAKLKGKQYLSETVSFRISDEAKHQLVSLKRILGFDSEADFSREAFLRGLNVIQHDVSTFEPNLIVIGNKIEKGLALSHEEFAYLGREAYQAYRTTSDDYNSRYFVDALNATLKISELVDLDNQTYDIVVRSTVPYDQSLQGFIHHVIVDAKNDGVTNPEKAMRLLSGLCTTPKTFEYANLESLNINLKPYLKSLLILAKYVSHRFHPQRPPLFHFDNYTQFIHTYSHIPLGSACKIEEQAGELEIEFKVEPDFSMNLRHKVHKWGLSLGFLDFMEFTKLLNHIPEDLEQFRLPKSNLISLGQGKFRWNFGHYNQELSLDDLRKLKGVINSFCVKFKDFVDAMILQWGDL